MIIGTAGHIDHGKTTLVRALTGVDTDRLPEEKMRGISIELGYAFLDVPGGHERLGFIDVPGHERLVHTMISGATGIDFAMLLVAADDGVMPQTREHLAVLSLLGLSQGAVVITKADRADAARIAQVRTEVQALIETSPLADAPIQVVSAATGDGVPALRALLFQAATAAAQRTRTDAFFRMAIDRSFSLDGVGTVVTGTVHAGRVQVGDELQLVPGGQQVRVRSLHAQNQAVQHTGAGRRVAIGLVGIDRQKIERGQWLAAPNAASAGSDRLDMTLTLWAGEAKPLRAGTPVHVHLGAATTLGTVAVLDRVALMPGETGLVQLVLRQSIGAWHGDRVVLRDASATRTMAGGQLLDPFGPVRYRRTPQRLAELSALALPDPTARLHRLLAASPGGLDLRRFGIGQGAAPPTLPPQTLRHNSARGDWALGVDAVARAQQATLDALAAFHARNPDELGPDSARLRRLALPRLPDALWQALLAHLQADGRLAQRGAFVHLREHGVHLSATEERIAQKVAPMLQRAGHEGAWVRDMAREAAESEPLVRITLARQAQRGELHQVVRDLYYPVDTMARLAGLARRIAATEGGVVTAARFRDATQLGRKRAIQILEHLDRIGLLRRVGDLHKLRADSTLFSQVQTEALA